MDTSQPAIHQTFGRVLLTIIFFALPQYAYRPFITDDAGTVSPESFELETAADYWNNNATFGLCFKHGITSRMDLGISFARCVLPQDERSYDPAELLLKFNLIPNHLATSFSGSFGSSCYSASAVFTHQISSAEVHLNAGFSTETTMAKGFGTFSAAVAAPLGKLSVGAEVGGSEDSFDWWQTGLRFAIVPAMAVDVGCGSTIAAEPTWNATTGLFFAFPTPEQG